MSTWVWILIILGTMVASAAVTFLISIKVMKKYISGSMDFDDKTIEMAMAQFGGNMNKKQKEKIKKQLQAMKNKPNAKKQSNTKNKSSQPANKKSK